MEFSSWLFEYEDEDDDRELEFELEDCSDQAYLPGLLHRLLALLRLRFGLSLLRFLDFLSHSS